MKEAKEIDEEMENNSKLIEEKYEDIISKLKSDHQSEIHLLTQTFTSSEEDYLEVIDTFKLTNEKLIADNVKLREEIEGYVENEEKLALEKTETEEVLGEQLVELKAEGDQLRQQIELLLHKCDKKDADLQRVQKEMQRDMELLEEDNYTLQIELDALKQERARGEEIKTNPSSHQYLLDRNLELEKKITELVLQQSNSQKYKDEIIELTTLLEMMQTDMDELKKLSLEETPSAGGIEAAKSESNRDFESREIVLGLKQEIAELNRLLDEEKIQTSAQLQLRSEAEQLLLQSQKDLENLKSGFDRRFAETTEAIASSQKQICQLHDQLNDKIGQVELLLKENHSLKSHLLEANEKWELSTQQAKVKGGISSSRDVKIEGEVKGMPTLLQLKKRLDELDKTSSLHKCSWRNLTSAVQAIAESDVPKQKMFLMRSQWGI